MFPAQTAWISSPRTRRPPHLYQGWRCRNHQPSAKWCKSKTLSGQASPHHFMHISDGRETEMNSQEYQMVIYWSEEDQAYLVEVPDLPGCMADGKTRQEALANAEIIIQEWVETAQELGRTVPLPQGRLLTVAEAAQRLGLSIAMVRRYCAEGKLAGQKIGRDWAIRQHDVEIFAAKPRHSGRPAVRYLQSPNNLSAIADKPSKTDNK